MERDYANGPTTGLLGESHIAPAMPKAKRKQLNIGITPDQYEAVRIAAEEEGVTVTVYCRSAIMEKAAPEPETPDVTGLPTWLIHFLLFISRGKTRPA